MENSGTLTITKCPNLEQIQDKVIAKPGLEFAAFLNDWMGLGADMPMAREQFIVEMKALGYSSNNEIGAFSAKHPDVTGVRKYDRLLELAQDGR
jgi:hypothetical protein